jgi:glutamate-1-semialdehyde aminotransferase
MPYLVFTYDDGGRYTQTGQTGERPAALGNSNRSDIARRIFYTETTRGGVLLHPNHHWFVTASHTDADLAHTLEVCADAFAAVRQSV